MRKITTLLFIACLSLFAGTVNAQSYFNIDASQSLASFKFFDTKGNELKSEYTGIYTGGYSIGYTYQTDLGVFVRPSLGMRTGGASSVIDDTKYSWKLQYADCRLGVGYAYKMNKINPYFMASGYYGMLLRGTQTLNNDDLDIKELGVLQNNDYGVIFTPGVKLDLSDFVSTYFEFNYLMGLQNVETDPSQKSTNFAYSLTLGLSFTITK